MKCRKCKNELKEVPVGFDAFSFVQSVKEMYCPNEKCEWFGVVVVVGEIEKLVEPKPKIEKVGWWRWWSTC